MKFLVEGMTCSHCEHAISKVVERLGGRAQVDLRGGTVAVDGVSDEAPVRAAIEEVGYHVIGHANASAPSGPGGGDGCCGSCHG